jgi:Mce-associated membrane protein
VQFATYDYRHLAADFAVTEANAVAPFRQQYESRVAGRLAKVLRKAKSRSTAKVISAGLVSLTSSAAVVDVFLDQSIVNKHTRQPRLDPQRIVMTLVRVGGQWKISRVVLP